jgi:hypothetical protein
MELEGAPSQIQAGAGDASKKHLGDHFHALAGRPNGHNDCRKNGLKEFSKTNELRKVCNFKILDGGGV